MIEMAEWKVKSLEMGYALECSNCGRKIGMKKYMMADMDISRCPSCDEDMDLDSLDEDELMDISKGEL